MMQFFNNKFFIPIALTVIFVSIIGYLGYQNQELKQNQIAKERELLRTKEELISVTQKLQDLQYEWNNFNEKIDNEIKNISSITNQIEGITGSVDTLDKLVKTDPELLQKYSKIYFLNENYFPPNLIMINPTLTNDPKKDLWLRKDVLSFLENLLNDANKSGVNLRVLSAFRSFDTQSQLKSTYSVTYGENTANKFSADQGYSEHQLGTTIDFTTTKIGSSLYSFENESAYKWLLENAYKYGFILSYPKNNTYYRFEPWHWRFVGKKLAKKLHADKKLFYDLDQREIDNYLIYLFDE